MLHYLNPQISSHKHTEAGSQNLLLAMCSAVPYLFWGEYDMESENSVFAELFWGISDGKVK